ncbi:Amino acid adenylation domain-containing protein [Sulfidibacter corallicola]|uniref:Amino acid adenylation domain-containing protein n=1 Tax=Sulfidibacter corallicola TaxID=2818388 RepID=A0A8A4TDJ1_SULCO|nr:amino acid adenylation domain-containing protein [Sulfidibacter corallicola]QTD48159.1 amino acid adenylation domain-containing protein [Sulfidibacter corallicola]
MSELHALLEQCAQRGITLTLRNGRLEVDDPQGGLDETLDSSIEQARPSLSRLGQIVAGYPYLSKTPLPAIPDSPHGELPPLTRQQREFLTIAKQQPNRSEPFIPCMFRVRGDINPQHLRQALNSVLQHHEILRTRYPMVTRGRTRTEIRTDCAPPFHLVDIRHSPASLRNRESRDEFRSWFRTAYDPGYDIPLRALLMRMGDREWFFALAAHRIACDPPSMHLLLNEVLTWYNHFHAGKKDSVPPPQPPPIQFATYAFWQRGWERSAELREALDFWRHQLDGFPPVIKLPTDRPRSAEPTRQAGRHRFRLTPELRAGLRALADTCGTTPFHICLTAFSILLLRHGAEPRMVIGIETGHMQHQAEGLIGPFCNRLPLPLDLRGDPCFAQIVSRVRDLVTICAMHARVPFAQIRDSLHDGSTTESAAPLYQVFFGFEAPQPLPKVSGLTFIRESLKTISTSLDLALWVSDENGHYSCVFEYSRDLFEAVSAARFAERFTLLLEAALDDPRMPISRLPMLGLPEMRLLLHGWQAVPSPLPEWLATPEAAGTRVTDMVARTAAERPHVAAVREGKTVLNYARLQELSNALAHRLLDFNANRQRPVALCLTRGPFQVVAVLAVLKAGAPYVPLDPTWPRKRLLAMLAMTRPAVILTDISTNARLRASDTITLTLDPAHELAREGEPLPPEVSIFAGDAAYIMFTSGSTGTPKGVTMPHAALTNLIRHQIAHSLSAPRTLQFASLSFDVSFQEIFSTWGASGTLIMIDEETRNEPRLLLEYLRSEQIERLFVPFTTLQNLAESFRLTDPPIADLREVVVAGEALHITPALVRFFERHPAARLINQYGPTETHVACELSLKGSPNIWPVLPPIGTPIVDARAYVLDEHLQLAPIGVPGELYLGGEILARGYWGRPRLTAAQFLPDPFTRLPGGRIYRTGDLARFDARGRLRYLGRIDSQVNIKGYRVEVDEVEAVLGEHPEIAACAVMAVKAPEGTRLAAYVVSPRRTPESVRSWRGWLEARLPEFMIPHWFVRLSALPRTPTGKLDRSALPNPNNKDLVD